MRWLRQAGASLRSSQWGVFAKIGLLLSVTLYAGGISFPEHGHAMEQSITARARLSHTSNFSIAKITVGRPAIFPEFIVVANFSIEKNRYRISIQRINFECIGESTPAIGFAIIP